MVAPSIRVAPTCPRRMAILVPGSLYTGHSGRTASQIHRSPRKGRGGGTGNVRPGTTSGVGVVERNLAGVVQPRYHPSVLPVPERCRTRDPACATPVATWHMGCRTVSLGRRKPGYLAQQPASCLTVTGPPFKGARRGRPATGRPDGSGCRLGIRATSRPSEQPHA